MLTCSMMRFLSLLLLGLCGVWCGSRLWSLCEVVYVDTVVAVTVIRACTVVCVTCVYAERV